MFEVRLEIVVAICVILVVYYLRFSWKKSKSKFPPGPIGLPFVGSVPFLVRDPHLKLQQLAQTYGSVFSIRLGFETVVVLSDEVAVREAFEKPEVLERPPHDVFSLLEYNSVFFTPGASIWKEQRRFVMKSLINLGLGKSKLEDDIQEEICHFLKLLEAQNGKPVEFEKFIIPSASNNISALVLGKRFDYDDEEGVLLYSTVHKVFNCLSKSGYYLAFPWIRRVPLILRIIGHYTGLRALEEGIRFSKKKVEEHKKTLNPDETRDFIDSYLLQMKHLEENGVTSTFTEDTLFANIVDLFGAGSESLYVSITWLIYTLAAFPEIQLKVQKEINDEIGSTKRPEFSNLKQMPYTHAVLLEIMRWQTTFPILASRYTTADVTLRGYEIPKGTTVLANFWAVSHDPKVFEEPDSFKPERFLHPNGQLVKKENSYIPFSVGKRKCPGEAMAYMVIFLYLVSILQKFHVRLEDGVPISFKGVVAASNRPLSCKVHLLPITSSSS